MNVKSILCDECHLILEHPITMPCGQTICKQHLDEFDEKISCKFCNDQHHIPRNGFCINKKLELVIDSYFELNPLRKKIRDTFDNINESVKEYDEINADAYVYDVFGGLRNKVDLHREELIKEINDRYEKMLNDLKNKEEKCNLNKTKIEKKSFSQLKEHDLPNWKQKLRVAEINEDELNELSSQMNDHIKQIRREIKKYKNNLLDDESIEFK